MKAHGGRTNLHNSRLPVTCAFLPFPCDRFPRKASLSNKNFEIYPFA